MNLQTIVKWAEKYKDFILIIVKLLVVLLIIAALIYVITGITVEEQVGIVLNFIIRKFLGIFGL